MARAPRKPSKKSVKAAAERAEARSAGEDVPAAADPVMSPPEVKRKRGRPSRYDPEFCELVIELGEQGKSITQMARTIGVTRETLGEWAKVHREFSDSLIVSEQLSQAWWEDQGQDGIAMGKNFNAATYQFMMRNRFRNHYAEKIEVKHDATAAFTQCWQAIGSGIAGGAPR